MLTTILVPFDGTPQAQRALPYATALAHAAHGWLILARVAAPRHISSTEAEREVAVDLEALAEKARAAGVPVESCVCHAYQTEVAEAIVELARERRADIILMATHARAGLGRLLYGSVGDQVARMADVPVVLIPRAAERPWPEGQPLRILVPLDGSALAEAALGPAAELARAFGAELLLLRVVQPPTVARFDAERELASAREAVERVAGRVETGQRVSVHVVGGFAVPTIATFAQDESVDLIVMATRGRSGLARLSLGSVATGTLEQATVPVAMVRPRRGEQSVGGQVHRRRDGHPAEGRSGQRGGTGPAPSPASM